MSEHPTPGQVAYEAWRRTEPRGWLYERPLPWTQLDASTQAAWEAAAQAVLDAASAPAHKDTAPPGTSPAARRRSP